MGTHEGLEVARLPAAVSPLVAAELAGAPRRRRVLAAFPSCLYVELGAHERVLAVLAADAVTLPIGIRLGLTSAEVGWGVEPGDHLVVGEGRVCLPRADVVAARMLRPGRVQPGRRDAGSAVALPESGVLGDLAHDLTAAALAGRPVDAGVRGLVGVGRGLTPSGDDALCGVLLALAALDAPAARRAQAAVRAAVRSVLRWTTSLSAALLEAAAEGYAVPDVARLVTLAAGAGSRCAAPDLPRTAALTAATGSTGRSEAPEPVLEPGSGGSLRPIGPSQRNLVDRVLAIGHTSGRDLLAGVSGALRAVDAHASTTQEGARRG